MPDPSSDQSGPHPVNAFSNAIDPRRLFPRHVDGLMRHLYDQGFEPERWRVLDASETRLDEDGQDVDFTLVQLGTDMVWRRRVRVEHGRVARIDTL